MKERALLVAVGLALLLAQAVVQGVLPAAFRPDLVLVYALALGLRAGSSFGLVLAFGAGFAVDALSGAPLGLFALLRGTACVATRLFDGALYLRAPGPWAIFVAAYAVADLALMGVCLHWFAPEAALPWADLVLRAPGTALASAIAAAPFLALFRRLDSEGGREGGLGLIASSRP